MLLKDGSLNAICFKIVPQPARNQEGDKKLTDTDKGSIWMRILRLAVELVNISIERMLFGWYQEHDNQMSCREIEYIIPQN